MAIAVDALSWILILAGSAFLIIGALGLVRLPDIFTRMHAAGITDSMAAWLLLAGLILQAGFTLIAFKLALIIVFMFFANPTTNHALAQAAISGGVRPILEEDRRPASGGAGAEGETS